MEVNSLILRRTPHRQTGARAFGLREGPSAVSQGSRATGLFRTPGNDTDANGSPEVGDAARGRGAGVCGGEVPRTELRRRPERTAHEVTKD